MSKPLGLIRDLSAKYAIIKQKVNDSNQISSLHNESFSGSERGFIPQQYMNDNSNSNTNNNTNTNNQMRTELMLWHLPPKYVEQYQRCCDLFDSLEIQSGKLQQEQQKRITPKFDENENKIIDNNIRVITIEMTNNLKEIENCIRNIQNDLICNNVQEMQLKENMKQFLLNKLAEYTKKLKVNQENYYIKYKEINKGDEQHNNNEHPLQMQQGNMFIQEGIKKNVMMERNVEINSLFNSINELGEMFKNVEAMVFQQGTILDRIDYNIDLIKDNVHMGYKQIVTANEKRRSSCARNANLTLLLINTIMGLMIIFKIFK